MNLKELKVLIVDDEPLKASGIRNALNYNGISKIIIKKNQAEVWEHLENEGNIDIIVTDMHYPLYEGMKADENAGIILIEKLKEKNIDIPVIICSSLNINYKDALGVVWYNNIRDIEDDFREILNRLK